MSALERLHWTTETVFSEEWEASVLRSAVAVSVVSEVPMRGEERQPRRGNRYYPSWIDVDLEDAFLGHVFPDEARELARILVAAADRADEIDNADVDVCGHWWPCDCASVSREGSGTA